MKKIIPSGATLIPDIAKLVFEGEIFSTYQWPQKLYNNSTITFEMVKRRDTTSVISIINNKILIIEDEQPHLGIRTSFPGGVIDDIDGSPLTGAKREVLEETGYSFNSWRLINVWQPYRKIEWFIYVYLAYDKTNQISANPGPGEIITPRFVNINQLKSLIDHKVGYLGEHSESFKNINTIDDLLKISEYSGQEVNR